MTTYELNVSAIKEIEGADCKRMVIVVEDMDLRFIQDLTELEIIQNCNDAEKLFKELIENDEELLHEYLTNAGYTCSKV